MKISTIFGLCLILPLPLSPQQLGGSITGIVRCPDGSPGAGAKVTAVTECDGMSFRLVQEARTSTDGSFQIPGFRGADCNKVRLYAENSADLWLKSGRDVFYDGDNGTTPLVEVTPHGPPTVSDILLGNRGGLVSIRLRDAAKGRFIWAELHVEKKPAKGATYGSMDIATGRDGSPDTMLLPAGEYVISVQQFSCGSLDFLAADHPSESFTVEAGQRLTKDISVEMERIKPAHSYSNPHAKPCKS